MGHGSFLLTQTALLAGDNLNVNLPFTCFVKKAEVGTGTPH
jgi:hypothetical protein